MSHFCFSYNKFQIVVRRVLYTCFKVLFFGKIHISDQRCLYKAIVVFHLIFQYFCKTVFNLLKKLLFDKFIKIFNLFWGFGLDVGFQLLMKKNIFLQFFSLFFNRRFLQQGFYDIRSWLILFLVF